ncbi:hypothetical protein RRG08_000087 [Elysia crispata]|uniref:Uncharacterized protein n=1 Tax=Elysia crispata TaxID=231223 RepID=A0AAE1A2A8_9GAST|nr:hypothetical protein RRG08_000087 [Elysia crispata]
MTAIYVSQPFINWQRQEKHEQRVKCSAPIPLYQTISSGWRNELLGSDGSPLFQLLLTKSPKNVISRPLGSGVYHELLCGHRSKTHTRLTTSGVLHAAMIFSQGSRDTET